MIGYPFTWKGDMQFALKRVQDHVERASQLGTEQAVQDARAWVELFAATAAFKVRRLMETQNLSNEVSRSRVSIGVLSRCRSAPAFEGGAGHDFPRQYDMTGLAQKTIRLRTLCNELIHAHLNLDCFSEDGKTLCGFIVASERSKRDVCYYVALDDFFAAIRRVCTDGFPWIVPDSWNGVRDR